MTTRIVIPPEKPPSTPPLPRRTLQRRWLNVTAGIIILAAMIAGLIIGYCAYQSWMREPTIHLVTYLPGSVDIEPNVDVTYNGGIVGRIDSAQVNLIATQLYVSRSGANPAAWHVLTFLSDSFDTAFADFLRIQSLDRLIRVSEISATGGRDSLDKLIRVSKISATGGKEARPVVFTIKPLERRPFGFLSLDSGSTVFAINGKATASTQAVIASGDDIAFRVHNQGYALRWTAPGLFTKVYGRLVFRQLREKMTVKTDSSLLINSSASVSISNTFGLTKTSARFVPTFSSPLISHLIATKQATSSRDPGPASSGNSQSFLEVRSGSGTSLDDLQATLEFLTSRTKLYQPPANRLEYMASNIDSTLAGIKETVNDVRQRTIPIVTDDVNTLALSLDQKLASLQRDISRLTATADRSMGTLTDSTASTMASLQLRIDLLLEELRQTTTQLRKTTNGVGADIRNVVK